MQPRFLVLEDSPVLARVLQKNLKLAYPTGLYVDMCERLSEFESRLSLLSHDVLIVDLNVLDAKPGRVAEWLLSLPTELSNKVLIHTSESWLTIAKLGLGHFLVLPKAAAPMVIRQHVEQMLSLVQSGLTAQ